MKCLIVVMLVGLLGGCATTRPEFLENRVVCTVSGKKAFVVSRWGPVGISSEIAEEDRQVICE